MQRMFSSIVGKRNFIPASLSRLLTHPRYRHNLAVDGNTITGYVAYALTDIGFGYPITPSSQAFDKYERMNAVQAQNALGVIPGISIMHSEAGVAASLHGCAEAGGLTTSFTSCQGLSLMIPEMFKMANSKCPVVVHVAARTLTRFSYNIFTDHSDVMPVRTTGVAMLASGSVQNCHDLALAAHLTAMDAQMPFCHFYDGFRTSHEMAKIDVLDYDDIAKLVDWNKITDFRRDALSPQHGKARVGVMNNDVGMQWEEAGVPAFLELPDKVQGIFDKIAKVTGRQYHLFDYFGVKDPEHVIILMGSAAETAEEAVDHINLLGKDKVGVIKVRLYRPFSSKHLFEAIPKSVKKICVLDRMRQFGSEGEPLYQDIVSAMAAVGDNRPVVNGLYGIGGKEFTPTMVEQVFENLKKDKPIYHFTVGIHDDVMGKSLPMMPEKDMTPEGTRQCIFWGLAADGTVGANQEAINIISKNTDFHTQGYFLFEAKKSGGWTFSHLRFGPKPIKSSYEIQNADYIACHQPSFLDKYPHMLERIKDGGIFVTNTPCKSVADFDKILSDKMKKDIAQKNVKLYAIDASALAREIGLQGHINMIMQSAFFQLFGVLEKEHALNLLRSVISEHYKKKGDKVVDKNIRAVDAAKERLIEIKYDKDAWLNSNNPMQTLAEQFPDAPQIVKDVFFPTIKLQANDIPVSAFTPIADGKVPLGTSKYEKRTLSHIIPVWDPTKCDTCNRCASVCPHAVLRPFLVTKEEAEKGKLETCSSVNIPGYEYSIQCTPNDCMGCTLCAEVCGRDAIHMFPADEVDKDTMEKKFDFAVKLPDRSEDIKKNLRGVTFSTPLLEFPGACGGCTQATYIRLITQMYGHRMYVGNPAGCAVVWGSYFPNMPYAANQHGHGPSYISSLFEDGAELMYGTARATSERRLQLLTHLKKAISSPDDHSGLDDEGLGLIKELINKYDDPAKTYSLSFKFKEWLATKKFENSGNNILGILHANDDIITKPSFWTMGGDGWAYDIGYGGLDHVLASNDTNINVIVLDNEFYANTGYQISKSTPHGAAVSFASTGRSGYKKDMGALFMTYGHIYVASIAFGANPTHALKCIQEAEAFPGPSLILAYSPCMGHNIEGTLSQSLSQASLAVKTGYWNLYSFDPRLKEKGKNPFKLASKEPSEPVISFLKKEGRYLNLLRSNPERAEKLFSELQTTIDEKYQKLKHKSEFFV